ncbi:Hypothetical protein R9X50_00379700 [Acrodontium crateriforme]|uniref:Carotenoid oxygenase n=1 Tax=Acrodontium crateriforme TaxID=150365 RepID=A0AAQ3M489_9PEZI|nr:Hypothetical protein R9X50_00379700 [Acrodontium crateriforme]
MIMILAGQRRKRVESDHVFPTPLPRHPYLTGNFAPQQNTLPLTPCTYSGRIPEELAGGEYIRNGSNPVSNEDLGRDAHWFDGDGMLSGVSFRKDKSTGRIEPEFVNQFILTDLYLSTLSSSRLKVPILPSIATLVDPLASFFYVTIRIIRTVLLVILSHLPGSKQKIKKISVANTNIIYHDGRALATCESGPPMRIQLPGLETVGWYDGSLAGGEPRPQNDSSTKGNKDKVFGQDSGLISFMREWTTAHPKVDPHTNEMLMFHSSFAPPYVQYSIIPQAPSSNALDSEQRKLVKLLNVPVPGIRSAKMMHDFGVSKTHTVIMDLPLSLDPLNQLKGKPPVTYDSNKPSRFGVFPRQTPEAVRWFETDASCIFHTANTWDRVDESRRTTHVDMLACRLTSATLVFAAGNIAPPAIPSKTPPQKKKRMPFFSKYDQKTERTVRGDSSVTLEHEKTPLLRATDDYESHVNAEEAFVEDQCRLNYYSFSLASGEIDHQWALTTIPFEFPSVRPDCEMQNARYVYGCSTTSTSFGAALGKATKVDALVKIDAATLIKRGKQNPPCSVTGVVDSRTMAEVLVSNGGVNDPVQVFTMPNGWYAQEPRFVPASSNSSEDDGYLLFYAFDESQLTDLGDVPSDNDMENRAVSELWIVEAKNMKKLLARIKLPQRVPYGLHGTWINREQISQQRPVESIRSTTRALELKETGVWMRMRDWIEAALG